MKKIEPVGKAHRNVANGEVFEVAVPGGPAGVTLIECTAGEDIKANEWVGVDPVTGKVFVIVQMVKWVFRTELET